MSRIISRAEAWTTAYESFQEINFTSFDYETIKQSMIDYMKLYFPEEFNDYIESSEFIAILELFAYLGEQMAYRIDMNAHENFLSTAQRKQSILRLAKLISYKASRNIPSRGLVKITSVSTTENVYDSDGINLANTVIRWNDSSNSKWKEQFLLVMNKILAQPFGTVSPNDRVQVDDILFELYQLNNTTTALPTGLISYTVNVAGQQVGMELTSAALTENGPTERRPEFNNTFTILYGNDGLGDASNTTGFFFYTKQGQMRTYTYDFDGLTPNQTIDLDVEDINETDVWINNIDPDTLEILDDGSVTGQRSGEWQQVDIANAQNIIFNTNENRNKYEVETLENDSIRIIFGDGEYASIPSGTFNFWVRNSLNQNIVIPQNTIVDIAANMTYLDVDEIAQTFSFTFSQIATIQNASESEDIENIRRVAPSVYYAQDRMVNGRDYNTFMLQDPSILKLRAINRTFAGESKYAPWNDPSGTYDNVKLFGDDLSLFYQTEAVMIEIDENKIASALLNDDIEPLLSYIDVFTTLSLLLPTKQPPNRQFTVGGAEYILNGGGPISGVFGGLNSLTGGDSAILLYDDYNSRGYQRTTVSGGSASDKDTGLAPSTPYSFNISIDGGAPTLVTITTPVIGSGTLGEITFGDLVNEINTEFGLLLVNGEAAIDGSRLTFYSNTFATTVITSSVLVTDVDLFSNITGFVALETPVDGLASGSGVYWDVVDGGAFTDLQDAITTYPNAVFRVYLVPTADAWTVEYLSSRLVIESPDTNFYHTNDGTAVVTYDTLLSNTDTITILAANLDKNRTGILGQNFVLDAIGHTLIPAPLPNQGLPNIHQLQVMTLDADSDNVPDNVDLPLLMDATVELDVASTSFPVVVNVPNNGLIVSGDETVTGNLVSTVPYTAGSPNDVIDQITVTNAGATFNIISGDGVDTFTLDSIHGDVTSTFPTGARFLMSGSAFDDGSWIVASSNWNGLETEVTVTSPITLGGPGGGVISNETITVRFADYVYFYREDPAYDLFAPIESTLENIEAYVLDTANPFVDRQYKREHGRSGFNFLWMHRASTFNLVDPSSSNIIDIFLMTRGYYTSFKGWVNGSLPNQPDAPTPLQLRSDYADLLDNKMISDTVVLHPGKFKILFGSKASAPLQAKFKIIRSSSNRLTDNQIKVATVTAVRNFFDVTKWEFGETFHFTELAAEIHNTLAADIDSVVLVPVQSNNVFGDLFQVYAREDEVFIPHITVDDIEIVTSLNPKNIKQYQ